MELRNYPELSEQLYWHTLPNGLPIAIVPRPGFTRKLAYFVTDFGAIHRDFTLNGQAYSMPAGIAHYLEHKMFDMPDGDMFPKFAALGATPNAFTSYDLTAYYFSCTENFPENLRLLLDFVSTPYFTEESVQKEQGIIGQEIGMNEDAPESRIFENLMVAMYRSHPVQTPILGTRETIAKITPELLTACHNAFYRPKNMLLCVIGDVDPNQVVSIAEATLPKADTAQVTRVDTWQEEMTCPQKQITANMEVSMPTFQLGFKCESPALGEEAVRAEAIGDLACEALFGESSPLYLRLYEAGLIDTSFGGGFETIDGTAMLTVSGDSDSPEQVKDAIMSEARRIVLEGLDEQDFLRMKRSALGRRIRDLDSFDSTAFRICAYHFSGFPYFDFPRIYRSIQEAEIKEFLQRVVTEQRCAMSVIYPIKEEKSC